MAADLCEQAVAAVLSKCGRRAGGKTLLRSEHLVAEGQRRPGVAWGVPLVRRQGSGPALGAEGECQDGRGPPQVGRSRGLS